MIILGVLGILSGFQFTYGLVDSFALFMILKVVSQGLSAAITPLTFKLLAENFPPERRTLANSILSSAKMAGIALSSMSLLMIKQFGWRASYCAIGGFSLFTALIGLIGLKSPKKTKNVQADIDKVILETEISIKGKPKKDHKGPGAFMAQLMELNENPVCKNVFMAGLLRTFGSTVVMAFSPIFFLKAFP